MKNLLSILFLFCLCNSSFSQEQKFDSIKQVLKEHKTQQDTTRVSLLIDLTGYHQTRSIDSSLILIDEALEISRKINFKKGEGYSLNALSTYYILKGKPEKAIESAMEAREIIESINDQHNLIYNNNLLSRIYTQSGELNKALELHLENIKLVENKPSSGQKAGFYFYVGLAYNDLGDLENAEKYYTTALNISKEVNFETGVSLASLNLSSIYNSKKEYEKALKMSSENIQFFRKYNQTVNIGTSLYTRSKAYEGLKQYHNAIKDNKEAIEIFSNLNVYEELRKSYLAQSDYYNKISDYKKSNEFLKLHYTIVDTINKKDKLQIIEDYQTKYETDKLKNDKDIAEQQAEISELENQKNKNLFIGSLCIAALILLSSILYFSRAKAKKDSEIMTLEMKEAKKRLEIEKQFRVSEIKALKSQMNPHFIFNALNSIQDFIIQNEKTLARRYLVKFSELIRIYLEHSQAESISISEEITALNLFLELEEQRFEHSFIYTINVDDDLEQSHLQIPTFLVQPYIENAINHGLLHKENERELTVYFENHTKPNYIICTITDNGIGREASQKINAQNIFKHKSFSSNANEKRKELLNKSRKLPISIEIVDNFEDNKAIGTTVIIQIPVTNI